MYTSGVKGMQEAFDISSEIVVLLGLTTNLFGLALGSVVLSSLSEIYGRRPVYLVSVLLFGLLILPVALAKNIGAVLTSRFFGGFFGGVMIASAPGSVTDVTDDRYRALALSCWSLGTMNGPVLGILTLLNSKPCPPFFMMNTHINNSYRSDNWRLCISVSWLEMDKLACPHLHRRLIALNAACERDICTCSSPSKNKKVAN